MPALLALLEEAAVGAFETYFNSVHISLSSSALSSAEYDPDSESLTIDFTDGNSHTYDGVDASTFVGLVSAASPGAYFNANIRNG